MVVNMEITVSGVVEHSYTGDGECVCCPGPHKFAARIIGIEGSGIGWLHDQAYGLPDGTPVRLTLEILNETGDR